VRIGRFVLQGYGGRAWRPFGRTDSIAASLTSTVVIAFAICYFIWTGSISTVWPMFGVANQLLAVVGLAVATTLVINIGRQKYAWITFMPLCFLAISALSAGYLNIRDNYWPMAVGADPALVTQGYANTSCTAVMMVCAVVILIVTTNRSVAVLTGRMPVLSLADAEV
jgi:carbon starvation protein